MLLANGLLTNEVLRWKAIGAAAWLAAVTAAACAACSMALSPAMLLSPLCLVGAALSPSAWLAVAALMLAQAPAFAAQVGALASREPTSAHTHRLLLHWPRAGMAGAAFAKLAARAGSVAGAMRVAAVFALHALSALLSLSLLSAGRGLPSLGAAWTLQYALWLAALYLLHWAYWSQDVLLFPSVQRHRSFRLRHRLPSAAVHAAKLAASAAVAAGATALLRSRVPGAGPAGAPPSLLGAAAALAGGGLCCFCWLACAAVIEVVFSERLRPGNYGERDELAAMAACLAGARGDLMQGLALHDASLLASDAGKAALRRDSMFSDETGERWGSVAAALLSELNAVSAASAAAAAPAGKAPAAAAAGTPSAGSHRWNVLPSAVSKAGLGGSRAQLEALVAVRCAYPRAALAASALSGYACASLGEDRFGVLQLTQPGLGEVLLCLLGALGATQQLLRSAASLAPRQLTLGPWRGNGDCAAWAACYRAPALDAPLLAMQDTLTVCLYRMVDTFGDGLAKVLAECKSQPGFGSSGAAAALLQTFFTGQA
ncbi:Nucleoporin Ndc1-Nup isoform A [Micractinium conductrix]|nr:Nucleoporin Ndc1-Nup isoform A [Micractinium conductrix]|eukprot:PSC68145.1 Nucleoporin Ndc1-Nup isoform A [Micractinium conductrix]